MLSITKINSASKQIASGSGQGKGYLHYLGAPSTRERTDFDDYARGEKSVDAPPPFWACATSLSGRPPSKSRRNAPQTLARPSRSSCGTSPGDLILANVAGLGQVVKRLRIVDGVAAALDSENPEFKPIPINDPADLRIHGKVVWSGGIRR